MRSAPDNCMLSGHSIPEGTPIVLKISAIHHNPVQWKDPEIFNPDRFDYHKEQYKSLVFNHTLEVAHTF